MTGDDCHDDAMGAALGSLLDGPMDVADELRRMARAEEPYTQFEDTSPLIKNIWLAAAEMLEDSFKKETNTIQ